MTPISVEEMVEAFDYATAVREEWKGAPIEDLLDALGFDAEALREVLEDRWAKYQHLFDAKNPHLIFVQGWCEGMMMLDQVRKGRA